jgi:HAD superfamily hydrolase (TIGR01509 family)
MTPRSIGSGLVPRLIGVIFDTDGVVTRTASVHSAAWKSLFDSYLRDRASSSGEAFVPFDEEDYVRYVDGRARYEGVEGFLASRGITLPRGTPGDAPGTDTVCALGNTKNEHFLEQVRLHGVQPFESTLSLARELRRSGIPTAVVSASENCAAVLRAAGAAELFDARVDGIDAAEIGLASKPDPALFLEAARRLGVDPAEVAVVEDALAGVEAGRRGGFGLVVGVDRSDRGDRAAALKEHGADVVVADLASFKVDPDGRWSVSTGSLEGPEG